MARNAEKAMTALARWRRMKEEEERGPVAKRPNDTRECRDLDDAERFRKEVILDISKKIALIQNPGLGEFKIRDLNDEINKSLRVKQSWEARIKELGGPDYRRFAPRELDREGREVASSRGYKYFGAAKDLPGVRELFEKNNSEIEEVRKTRAELMKNVDADYYGYLDDDDGLLVPLETEAEKKSVESAKKHYAEHGVEMPKKTGDDEDDDDIYKMSDTDEGDLETKESLVVGEDGRTMAIRHVVVPTQQEMEQLILARKKQALIDKYAI